MANTMVLFFTGTGNSRYVAEKIAAETAGDLLDLGSVIKNKEIIFIQAENLVLTVPVYAWRIPRIVQNWVLQADFSAVKRIWFVLTCGGGSGNASSYNKELCLAKGCEYMGTAEIVMPENYIAMFNAPDKAKASEIVKKAEPIIMRAARTIAAGEKLPAFKVNLFDRLLSGAVNSSFYKFAIETKQFKAEDKCTGCGLCARKCPLNNISLVQGRPVWDNNCTHCMACICYCPEEAIEYGKKSLGKPRYHFEALNID